MGRGIGSQDGLEQWKILDEAIGEDTEYVYLPGAFTKSVIEDITPKKLKNIRFILKDPTKVFIDDISWQKWIKKGLKISVLQNIKVAAITVNPFHPGAMPLTTTHYWMPYKRPSPRYR